MADLLSTHVDVLLAPPPPTSYLNSLHVDVAVSTLPPRLHSAHLDIVLPAVPPGPTISVWNGTAELAAQPTVWDGSSEIGTSVEVV